jgi:hypothetical protein
MGNEARTSVGFGVPTDEVDPQRFIVRIGASTREPVTIIEDFGISGPQFDTTTNLQTDQVALTRNGGARSLRRPSRYSTSVSKAESLGPDGGKR